VRQVVQTVVTLVVYSVGPMRNTREPVRATPLALHRRVKCRARMLLPFPISTSNTRVGNTHEFSPPRTVFGFAKGMQRYSESVEDQGAEEASRGREGIIMTVLEVCSFASGSPFSARPQTWNLPQLERSHSVP
jgi:hypothetical protein